MEKKPSSHAITSMHEEKVLGEALRKRSYKYYLLYRLLIDTGITLKTAVSLLVGDIKGRECIYVQKSKSKPDKSFVYMSNALIKEFEPYLENMPLTSYAFCAQDNTTPLREGVFRDVLIECAKNCDMENITPISLKKTHMYHRYLQCGDINVIRRELKLPSNKHAFEYIGISSESTRLKRETHEHIKQIIFSPDYLVTIKNQSNETNMLVEACLKQSQMSYSSCLTLYKHLEKYIQDMKELNMILSKIKE